MSKVFSQNLLDWMTNLKMAGRSSVKAKNNTLSFNDKKPAQPENTLGVPEPTTETESFVKRLSMMFYASDSPIQSPADGPGSNNELHTQGSCATGSIGSVENEIYISPVPSRNMYSLASTLFGLNELLHKDFHEFETRLRCSSGFVISTKLTATPGNSMEYGYQIRTIEEKGEPEGKGLGNLVPVSDDKGCKLLWHTYLANENDPMSFVLKSAKGESLLAITGLDDKSGLEDVVFITQGEFNNAVGSVNFGHLGASGDAASLVTIMVMAGKDRTRMVPLSVIDMDGELAFIFREGKDNPNETELLTADGTAIVVAKMGFGLQTSKGSYFGKTFRVEIVDGMTTLDKTLIVGVGVVVFNRWLQKKRAQHCCSIV